MLLIAQMTLFWLVTACAPPYPDLLSYRFLAGRSTAVGGSRLPERFADAALWRWRRKYEHPVYMTSNNDYGAKPPSQPMMPLSWHGVKGEFTKNYIKAEVRTGNFTTGLPSSRVHDTLTELC